MTVMKILIVEDDQDAAAYVHREWSREAIIRRYEWIFTYNVDAVEI